MSDTAIRVEGLSKQYQIGGKQESYQTLRDNLTGVLASPFRGVGKLIRGKRSRAARLDERFWALKDVSFEIKRGEAVGIIGHNGAGKSTLLKILSRITEPTTGFAEIHGRVGSLLEVGTGFHPELTGRENIYLNGAILGMKRVEIQRKFDEIVAFAEVEKFIDTPVKRYSSGMYLRLAFSVAAHLEPEILIVDEVLAVGDAAFQKKCLTNMGNVAKKGMTVVLVSHNLAAIGTLCEKVLLLKEGRVEKTGSASEVISYYHRAATKIETEQRYVLDDDKIGYSLISLSREIHSLCGKTLKFSFEITCPEPCANVTAGLVIYNSSFGDPIAGASSKFQGTHGQGDALNWRICCDMGQIPLNSGIYMISIWLGNQHRDFAKFSNAFTLHVAPSDPFAWGDKVPPSWGYFFWKPDWNIVPLSSDEGSIPMHQPSRTA